MITSINPATGEKVVAMPLDAPEDVDRKLDAAVSVQAEWRRAPVGVRIRLLRRIAARLRAESAELAKIITLEMGKPIAQSRAEIEKCAVTLEYYADAAPDMLADRPVDVTGAHARVVLEPLGVILAVMPWNYPFWQYFRFAAPAIAAGNAPLLKHASNVPGCARAIERLLEQADAPAGLCPVLYIGSGDVADLIEDPRVAAVTLTGSTEVGRIIAGQAGRALKKQVLELGGSDPFLVLADAPIEEAALAAVTARFTNGGQSCVNAKRFIVVDGVADAFVDAFVRHASQLVIGDPFDERTQIGPMARSGLRDELHEQVVRTLTSPGATLRHGGAPLDGPGFFYAPTIIDHVSPGDAAFDEETFGPVAAVVRARDADHAVQLANQTEFGLAATIWSADVPNAEALAARIDAGAVFVNGVVASDARLPFGGIKASGYGRELGAWGLQEFMNVKTLWVGGGA